MFDVEASHEEHEENSRDDHEEHEGLSTRGVMDTAGYRDEGFWTRWVIETSGYQDEGFRGVPWITLRVLRDLRGYFFVVIFVGDTLIVSFVA